MKKRFFVIIAIAILVFAITAYATVQIATDVNTQPEKVASQNSSQEIYIETETVNDLSKFGAMATKLEEQIESVAEYNNALINYKFLEDGYRLDTSELNYIRDLIIGGYNGIDVINAAYFWLDTSEDVSIIKTMCDWKIKNSDYEGKFWEENAFNFVTNNKYGVLSEEDIEEYTEKGVTIEAIMTANRLCRKGEYTIEEVLEKYQKGYSMADIAVEIDTNLYKKEKLDYAPHMSKSSARTTVDDSEIFESRELAILSGQPENAYTKDCDNTGDLSVELESLSEKIIEEIKNELKAGGYFRAREKEDK